jgi:hypothetical protein
VLCSKWKLPLVTAQTKLPHLTGFISISATGQVLKPLIILKSLKKLKTLSIFEDHCFFSTSFSGWITKDLFTYFALIFIVQISQYRMTLPENIREKPILLILDGHTTRLCLEAALIFSIWKIDVVILPSHTSHLVQPFDVAVASPLKTEFKKEIDKCIHEKLETDPEKREKSMKLREKLVRSFIDALRRSATPSNIKAGFSATGICPCDPNVPLSSQFVAILPDPSVFMTSPTGTEVGNM